MHVKRLDISNLFILEDFSFSKSSSIERTKIKKHVKKINQFIIEEYKHGGGANCIELWFLKKRLKRLNQLLENYNILICISLCAINYHT